MNKILLVGAGGFIGALLRYLVSGLVQQWVNAVAFPSGTLAVNIVGCFFMGALSQLVEIQMAVTPEMRLLIMVGLLGSFTTYSTFGNESFMLLQDQRFLIAFLYIGSHLLVGLAAVFLGRFAVLGIWG